MEIAISIILAVIVVAIAAVMVANFYRFFRKYGVLLLVTALLFGIAVYAVGYWNPDYETNAFNILTVALQSIFSSARFFIFDSDYSLLVNEQMARNVYYMFAFSLSAIYTMFAMTTTVLSLFAARAIMSAKLYFTYSREAYIFLGVNEEVLKLAFNTKENNRKAAVIIIDDKQRFNQDIYGRCYKKRAILFGMNKRRADTLYLPRAYYKRILSKSGKIRVIIASGDEAGNASLAAETLVACDANQKYARMYCRTDSAGKEEIFDEMNLTNWEIRLFSEREIAVDSLLADYPVVDRLNIDKTRLTAADNPRLFIAGDALNRELLIALVREAQFENMPPEVVVWGEKADLLSGEMQTNAPELYKCASVRYYCKAPYTAEFYTFLGNNPQDYIVFASNDFETNAVQACSYYKRFNKRVYAYSRDDRHKELYGENAAIFGADSDIFTYRSIIEGALDMAGRAVNMHYNNGIDDYYGKSIFEKSANDAFGLNIPLKMKLLGLEITDADDPEAMSANEYREYAEPVLDLIARQEHARWNAFYYTSGYTTWPLDAIPEDYSSTKDTERRLHACLVSYDELDEVSERFKDKVGNIPFGYKGYDMLLIEAIAEILNYCGLGVKRSKSEDNICLRGDK